jgi:hypothetical protein
VIDTRVPIAVGTVKKLLCLVVQQRFISAGQQKCRIIGDVFFDGLIQGEAYMGIPFV